MDYKLVISEQAEDHIDQLFSYLMCKLHNPDAAGHLLNGLEGVYRRLEDNPYQFPFSNDLFLLQSGYREALLHKMAYRVVFRIQSETVFIVGVFHELEEYQKKTFPE